MGKSWPNGSPERIVNAVAMTKIRTDIDRNCRDQLMVLAADQVLHAEIK